MVERLHPVIFARLAHRLLDGRSLPFRDQLPDASRIDQHLDRRHSPLSVGAADQALADHGLQRHRQHRSDLVGRLDRERVHDPVEGLLGVVRVKSGKDEVSGLRRVHREFNRFGIPHLAHQDDVGILSEDAPEGLLERLHVASELALVDRAHLVRVDKLDGVLNRDDVDGLGLVEMLDHRGERRGLAAPRRPCDEDHPLRCLADVPEHRGKGEGLDGRRGQGDRAECRPEDAHPLECVHAEPR